MKTQEGERKALTLRVLPETRRALLHAAIDRDATAGALVDRLTAEYLKALDADGSDTTPAA